MKRRLAALDLTIALIAVMALLVPVLQFAAAAHVAHTEAKLEKRYTRVCNVEDTLCVIASGATAARPFGRLLPGH